MTFIEQPVVNIDYFLLKTNIIDYFLLKWTSSRTGRWSETPPVWRVPMRSHLPFSSTRCTLLLRTTKRHYSEVLLYAHSNTPPFSPTIFEQRTSKRAQVSVFLYTAAAYRPMGPADAFKESGIAESVSHRPGGGERVRWRYCSSRGQTADRPTAPDTAEHIDCRSAHTVASH